MHDVVTGKPVACRYVLVDCLCGIFFEGLVNSRNCIAEAIEIEMFCHNAPVKVMWLANRSMCSKYAEHRFTNLLNDRLIIPRILVGVLYVDSQGAGSPQGNCRDS